MRLRELTATRLGIWGFGLEGRAALGAFASSCASVVVVDEREDALTVEPVPGVEVNWGSHQLERLLGCDLVLVSPGIPRTHPFFAELKAEDIRVTSGSAMWLESNADRTIGVTGTKGKSTTSTLIHNILRHASVDSVNSVNSVDSVLAGNIGLPLIGLPDDERLVIAELSSYQCSWITRSPRIAVVTNLFEEHLPWHGTLRKYWEDKARIATRGAEFLICDAETLDKLRSVDCNVGQSSLLLTRTSGTDIVTLDGTSVSTVEDLPPSLRARHLVSNVRAAVLAASAALGASVSSFDLLAGLREFSPLPHRLEVIGRSGGLVWVDDTLSTAPESVIAAIEASEAKHTVLIIGGQDRGVSYKPLNDFLVANSDSVDVIAIPSNGLTAVGSFRKLRPEKVHVAANLREAVGLASLIGSPGGHVILSPGAPSYDFHRNYRDKSAEFREAVQQLEVAPRADDRPRK